MAKHSAAQAALFILWLACASRAQLHLPGTGPSSTNPRTTSPKASPTPRSAEPKQSVSEKQTAPQSDPAAFDYYVLSLSWSPNFCADPARAAASPQECIPGKGTGFAVHGLWPQAIEGKSPESCGPAKAVPRAILNIMAPYMPSPDLVRHEWAIHGTCSGLGPADYFESVIRARVAVQLPVQMTSIEEATTESAREVEAQFANANPGFPAQAFRASCRDSDFAEVRVCFDRMLKPRECTASVGECSLPTMRIRPAR